MYLPGFFTDIPVEVAQEALLTTGTPGELRRWLILTAILLLDTCGTLLPGRDPAPVPLVLPSDHDSYAE